MSDVLLEARGISKSFPGVRALEGANLQIRTGRLTAVLGENGAGKSTLMNILSGVFPPDAGEVLLDGQPVRFESPRDAREQGIGIIFQELSLLPNLTVAENLFLDREPCGRSGLIDYATMNRDAAKLLERVDLDASPEDLVGNLRVGQQQLLEIARATSQNVKVLILDEPTSSLSAHEVDVLFDLINQLKRRGVGLVYITHKFEELAPICDDVTVLRDGRVVGSDAFAKLDRAQIVRLMAGRETAQLYERKPSAPGSEILRAENLTLKGAGRGAKAAVVNDVNFTLRQGEVLGIFGLIGAGRTELLECVFGLHAGQIDGTLVVSGEARQFRSPADAIAAGIVLAPEDRKKEGLVLEMGVGANTSLASLAATLRLGLVDETREAHHVRPFLERFRVKTPSLQQRVRNLSGGNQQKVILAKWLAAQPRILLLDEPTRGIDINAKREIYAFIDELAQAGLGLVVVSSELPEVLALADRVMVMCEGKKTAEFTRAEASPEAVLQAALPVSRTERTLR